MREISEKQNFVGFACRPAWAGGAHVFVSPVIASEVEDVFEGVQLRKENIVLSPEFRDLVLTLLGTQTAAEHMYNRVARMPQLRSEEVVPLSPISFADAALAREDVSTAEKLLDPVSFRLVGDDCIIEIASVRMSSGPSNANRQTHTTGSRPRSQPAASRSYGHIRKKFTLMRQLGSGIAAFSKASPHDEVHASSVDDEQPRTIQQNIAASSEASLHDKVHAPSVDDEQRQTIQQNNASGPAGDDAEGDTSYDIRSEASSFMLATSHGLAFAGIPHLVNELVDEQCTSFPSWESFSGPDLGKLTFCAYVENGVEGWVSDIVQPLLCGEFLVSKLAGLSIGTQFSLE